MKRRTIKADINLHLPSETVMLATIIAWADPFQDLDGAMADTERCPATLRSTPHPTIECGTVTDGMCG